ncbi:MAG: 2-C-methyl-D-erythritol 4-phosphate cytidylyltransferase [Armatimonadetes bacterium]|nr:2-C-methyl-D-erythritol 4-phosphate cytidylyltransferase [Armatimonadota bacterium]
MRTFAILLAAGRSERFGQDKLWLSLDGRPLWTHAFGVLTSCKVLDGVGVVCQSGRTAEFNRLASGARFVVEGGATRQESCRLGLAAVPDECDAVIIHDAARPYVTEELVKAVVAAVERNGAAFAGIPVTDTIKLGAVDSWTTLDRSRLVAVQTPQGARRSDLVEAHRRAAAELTDDVALLEAIGLPVTLVPGDPRNIKVTLPSDISSTMVGPVETRTGFGYDVHAFSSDAHRALWLGGVEFDEKPGLEGHSDADALIHAIVDALLGAAGLGDIGQRFPNTDPRWKDAPSRAFLVDTAERLNADGWSIAYIDASVLAERPKVMPRSAEMCAVIATSLGIARKLVNIKATTNEGLGAIGRGEGVAAMAVATLRRPEKNP